MEKKESANIAGSDLGRFNGHVINPKQNCLQMLVTQIFVLSPLNFFVISFTLESAVPKGVQDQLICRGNALIDFPHI